MISQFGKHRTSPMMCVVLILSLCLSIFPPGLLSFDLNAASAQEIQYVSVTKVIQPDPTAGKDTMISGQSTYLTYNYGASQSMNIGQSQGGVVSPARSLLQFDLSSIPSSAAITKAEMKLFFKGNSTASMDISAHRVTRSWTEGTGNGHITNNGAIWQKYDGVNNWATSGGDFNATSESTVQGITNGSDPYTWDITSLAQSWFNGTTSNYGVLMKGSTESGQSIGTAKAFYSSDDPTNASKRPQLVVTYTVDDTPPTLEISSPIDNQYIKGQYNIVGSVNDISFKNAVIEYGQGSNPTTWTPIATVIAPTNEDTMATWDVSSLSGAYTLRITASDTSNNTTVATIPIFIDGQAPTASINSPNNQDNLQGIVNVIGSAVDNLGINYMELFVQRLGHSEEISLGTITNTTGSWAWDTQKHIDGEYKLKLVAYDNAGAQSIVDIKVKVDNNSPKLGLESYWGAVEGICGNINLSNGNLVIDETDIKIPGRGLGIDLSRTYNSQSNYNGPIGWGWNLNIPEFSEYSDGSIVITDSDGTEHKYTLNQDGTYSRPPGKYVTLMKKADGTLVWAHKDGSRYIFDEQNQRIILADKNDNEVTYQLDNNGKLASVTDSSGRTVSLQYDQATRKIVSITDSANRRWQYGYDASGNLVSVTDPMGQTTTHGYDADHNLIAITDAKGNTITLSYAEERLISTTDPLSKITEYAYDIASSAVFVTNASGHKIIYRYNGNGNLTMKADPFGESTTYIYDGSNNLISVSDELARTTTFTYDSMGNKLSATDPLNRITNYTYDSNNDVTRVDMPDGNSKQYQYDVARNLISIDEAGKISHYSYDIYGKQVSTTDPKGETTEYTYDNHGNLVQATDPLGKVTAYAYDQLGNKTSVIDANGNTTLYEYNLLGWLTRVTDAKGNDTSYIYDVNGNKLTATDAKGNISSYGYNALNRLISSTEGGKTKGSEYDAVGNLIKETLENSQTIAYAYDANDRLLQTVYSTGKTITYIYDQVGNRLSMTDSKGTTTYTYDVADQLIQEVGATGKIIVYGYDAVGALKSKTVAGKTEKFIYDGSKNLVSAADSLENTTTFSYDQNSNRTAVIYPNHTNINYSYDAANKLVDIKNFDVSGNILSGFSYAYYDNGQIKTVTESTETSTTYEYDSLNRLIKVTEPTCQTISYTYDAVGNRLSMVDSSGSTSYEYDAQTNQLTRVVSPSGTTTYAYDAKGNVVSKTDSIGTITYAYDPENRLIQASKPDSATVAFAYDGDNRRVSKTTSQGTINYIFDESLVVAETDASGNILASYTYDDKGMPISMVRGGQTYYYHYNSHGDVVALTDQAGALVASYKYDAWGNIVSATGSVENPYLYAGYRYDAETGLYFLQSRYYDPQIGRFISKDKFAGFDEDPQTQHKYVYCENDPVNKVDPSGDIAFVIVAVPVAAYAGQAVINMAAIGLAVYFAKGKNKSGTQKQRTEELKRESKKHKQGSGGIHGEGRTQGGKKGRYSR